MKIRGVDFVLYRVGDLSQAVEFYRDTLGLPLTVESEDWCEFDVGNVTLALQPGQKAGQRNGARIAFAVDDIDDAYAKLSAKGTSVPQRPQDYGVCRAFEVLDPDGNRLLLHRRADGTFGP